MGTSISTNVNSLKTQENYRVNSEFQSGVIARLSSGYRIGKAGDDPAGLSIANAFRAGSAQLTQGVRNLNDGISRLQIVDGGMSNISQILDRLKTLATQSASDTWTARRNRSGLTPMAYTPRTCRCLWAAPAAMGRGAPSTSI